jgi:PPIC-type PPIASE domain
VGVWAARPNTGSLDLAPGAALPLLCHALKVAEFDLTRFRLPLEMTAPVSWPCAFREEDGMNFGKPFVMCVLTVCSAIGCSKRSAPNPGPVPTSAPEESTASKAASKPTPSATGPSELNVFHYPPARWQLASFEELNNVTLWLGHIAIRHEGSQSDSLRAPGFEPDGPNPARSPEAAVALAHQIYGRLLSAPEEFETLAKKHSEDRVTQERGGYLGGVRASQLAVTDFLDVLATLKPGELSKPFQTPYGIHILKRYPPPAPEKVAGERIVIGYEGVFALGREAPRDRALALELAQKATTRARENPAKFGELVAQYSDNVDRSIHGFMGVYSTQDPGYFPLEVDALSRVKVGEIYGPIDTPMGFVILKRVPLPTEPDKEYAMKAIEVALDTSLPDEETAVKQARSIVTKLEQVLASDPNQFEELQQVYRWTYPKGDLALTHALDKLSPGQVAPDAVRHGMALVILKRLDPKELPPEPVRLTELPNPSDPDYDALIGVNSGTQLAAAARAFVSELGKMGTGLEPKALEIIATTLSELAAYLEQNQTDSKVARTTIHAAFESLARQLDKASYSKLLNVGRTWVIHQMMPSAEAAPEQERATIDG